MLGEKNISKIRDMVSLKSAIKNEVSIGRKIEIAMSLGGNSSLSVKINVFIDDLLN